MENVNKSKVMFTVWIVKTSSAHSRRIEHFCSMDRHGQQKLHAQKDLPGKFFHFFFFIFISKSFSRPFFPRKVSEKKDGKKT